MCSQDTLCAHEGHHVFCMPTDESPARPNLDLVPVEFIFDRSVMSISEQFIWRVFKLPSEMANLEFMLLSMCEGTQPVLYLLRALFQRTDRRVLLEWSPTSLE
jgi:hypothetical protein